MRHNIAKGQITDQVSLILAKTASKFWTRIPKFLSIIPYFDPKMDQNGLKLFQNVLNQKKYWVEKATLHMAKGHTVHSRISIEYNDSIMLTKKHINHSKTIQTGFLKHHLVKWFVKSFCNFCDLKQVLSLAEMA